jgi:hypothetical protein
VTQYIHHATRAPTDYGNGVILMHNSHAGYHNPSDYWGATRVTFVDCATGRAVELTRTARNNAGWRVINKERAVTRLLEDGTGMQPDQLFAMVTERAERRRVPMESWTIEGETCGCRAFYPELRGNKKRYEAEQ